MSNIYTCPKCLSQSAYFVMPSATSLKCMDCEHSWPFTFIIFIQEWKEKNANVCAGENAHDHHEVTA